MGQKDLSEKILADYNDVFADIINVRNSSAMRRGKKKKRRKFTFVSSFSFPGIWRSAIIEETGALRRISCVSNGFPRCHG